MIFMLINDMLIFFAFKVEIHVSKNKLFIMFYEILVEHVQVSMSILNIFYSKKALSLRITR